MAVVPPFSSQFRKSKLTASSFPSQLQVSCPWHATWPQAISRAVCAPQEVHSARGEAEVSGEGSSAASRTVGEGKNMENLRETMVLSWFISQILEVS
jgi:hypothetical protein